MEALNQISATLALTMGLAWASGINLYVTLLTLGFLALMIWLLPRIWDGVKKVFRLIINLFHRDNPPPSLNPP